MRLLAIDPGNVESAYVLMDEDYRPTQFGKIDNDHLAWFIIETVCWKADKVAIEMIARYGVKGVQENGEDTDVGRGAGVTDGR